MIDLNEVPELDLELAGIPYDVPETDREEWVRLGYREVDGLEEYACFINTGEGIRRISGWSPLELALEDYDSFFITEQRESVAGFIQRLFGGVHVR